MYTKVFALFALFALAAASCPGCPVQGDPEDAKVVAHLKAVLKTQNSDDEIVKVLSVQTQVVSGIKYSVKFQTRDASGLQKVCQSEFLLQPWVSKQPQVMSYKCSKLSEISVDALAYEREFCAGCPTKHDPKEYDVSEYLKKVLATQNSDDEVTKVVSVTTQVVSGVKYTVEFESQDPKTNAKKVCKTEFISQPWVSHVPQVLSFKCQQKSFEQFTVLRQLEETDPYDVTLQVQRLVENHHPAHKLSKIISVKTRDYNGVEYTAEFEVVVVKTNVKEICKSLFYAQKYLPRPQVASYSCHKKVSKRSLPGGEEKQDPTKYDVSSELKEVLASMNSDDEVTKVISVTTQVVSGVKYTVEFESQDPKTNEKKICSTVFISQPWVSKKPQILSFKCNKQVQKRSVCAGCPYEQDPAEVDVTEELKKVMASQNSEDKITKVVSIKTQVVAGMKYTVEFETENPKTHAVHMCKTVYVSAPWVSKVPQVESYKCY